MHLPSKFVLTQTMLQSEHFAHHLHAPIKDTDKKFGIAWFAAYLQA